MAGAVEKLASVRIKRNGQVVGLAKVKRVQREKELVDKVSAGTECGLMLDSDTPVKVGDKLDFFKQEEHIRKLEKKSSH
ncbi:MAG: Translation initiation factor IF-2 [Candidatus Berkelbacteria bacterium Gr01-1014_85]|uniref:Translation initiation factor IF-2 n=1 Tax=Candidatus Berkelbacteria bacterium Gr01-1014_85 TaxID=2017150 RepID=A0A554J9J2_9BACT|nr:MAG: Translation initiation factor IF-2 [Candidatus Berkelbacteria bacterium Gr01-1014_85]